MPRSGLCWLDGMDIKSLREPSRSSSYHRTSVKLSTIMMLSTSARHSRFAATTTIMVASFSNAAAFSTATSRLTSILNDPSLITCDSPPSQTFDVIDPGASAAQFKDGSAVIAHVRRMGRDDAKDAINRAHIALPDWRDKTTAAYRSGILTKWSSLIKESAEDIAKIMTLESGKPLAESRGEVGYGTSFLDYYAAEAIRPNNSGGGFISPSPFAMPDGAPRGKMMAINEAVGVCGLITPWNFPIAMITRKVGPALAAGCACVLKPSELTPLTAIALETLAKRAGVPEGVFELVTADRELTREVGDEMCVNSIIKKISFTGSTPVGKLLMKQSSDTVKRLSLELGGNASFIVFDDADLDVAVNAAMSSKFRNAGQTCVCSDRFLVHKSIEEEFVARLAEKVGQIKIGHGLEDGVTMGPVISNMPVKNLSKKVEAAISDGATCVVGGSPLVDLGPNFFEPTILTNVDTNSLIWCTETFGPVVAVTTFDTEDEAVTMANDSSVGLASYICTRDMSRIFRVSSALECGMVGVNEGIISSASAPFGGVKESGLGREGSALGIKEYLNTKYVFLNC
ncbi:succinate-semialdehyde dehydrogenase [Skeletonema marinoi]|uniref:Succinate-semialdehyde dehydrogenase, mitochondrial n=1 Tax=Skeletonema marinoi TaxID=267567 RepID=A0AAD9DH24_9STRA|nr:succinate-semialdehyde dehydrogenase [Skeletonema marinoi]